MEEYKKPELARCPFCGGIADLRWDDDDHYLMWIECARCKARGPKTCSVDLYDEFRLDAVIEAINSWNMRDNGKREKMEGVAKQIADTL